MTIADRLSVIREKITAACKKCGRPEDAVKLLAVSKTFPARSIMEAWEAGQVDFGESRQQEAGPKIADLPKEIRWHFIGRLQRNKVRKVLGDFSVIHGVGSLRLAAHIDHVAQDMDIKPDIYLQVDIANEASKGGFPLLDLESDLSQIAEMKNLSVQGLMVIPPYSDDLDVTRKWFKKTRDFRDYLENHTGIKLPGLSMGMSGDFETAIEEGSTVVRVGSAIFGERDYPV